VVQTPLHSLAIYLRPVVGQPEAQSMSSTHENGRLSEEYVQDSFHSYLKSRFAKSFVLELVFADLSSFPQFDTS
jgi:hypothetical protein